MERLKKIGIVVLVGFLFFIISQNFTSTDVTDRAIVLGLGIDFEDEFVVTAEIVKAGMQSEQTGGVETSLFLGKGETVSEALSDMYLKTGKEISVGQCIVIVLGENAYKTVSPKQMLSFFVYSDAFKDGILLTACEGSAQTLFQTKTADESSVSFSISGLFNEQGRLLRPTSDLTNFVKDQLDFAECSFLNIVKMTVQPESVQQKDEKQVLHVTDSLAIFKSNAYLCEIKGDAFEGLCIVDQKVSGENYVVENNEDNYMPQRVTIEILQKNVGFDFLFDGENSELIVNVKLKVKRTQTDSFATGVLFFPEETKKLSASMLEQVQTKVEKELESLFEFQIEKNFDVLEVKQGFYRNYKKEWLNKNVEISDVKYRLNVIVFE